MNTYIDSTIVMTPKIIGNGSALNLGHATQSVAGGVDVTLDPSIYQNRQIELTGVITANINVIVPLTDGAEWVIINSTTGAFTLTIKGATGTGIVVGSGKTAILRCNGTNIYRVTADV